MMQTANALTGNNDENLQKKLKDEDSNYAFQATFDVDAGGELTEVTVDGSAQKAQEQYQIEKALYNAFEYDDSGIMFPEPSDVTAVLRSRRKTWTLI